MLPRSDEPVPVAPPVGPPSIPLDPSCWRRSAAMCCARSAKRCPAVFVASAAFWAIGPAFCAATAASSAALAPTSRATGAACVASWSIIDCSCESHCWPVPLEPPPESGSSATPPDPPATASVRARSLAADGGVVIPVWPIPASVVPVSRSRLGSSMAWSSSGRVAPLSSRPRDAHPPESGSVVSEERFGVDVDTPRRSRATAEQRDRVRASQDDVEAPSLGAAGDVRRSRTGDRDVDACSRGSLAKLGRHRDAGCLGRVAVRQPDRQPDETTEGRRAPALADRKLLVVERSRVVLDDSTDRPVIRPVRLDDRAPESIASAGSSDRLRHELVGPFRRPLVGQAQGDVGGDDPDERHARNVERLGDEARPDEHVEPPLGERIDDPLGPTSPRDDVAIEPTDPQHGISIADLTLDTLGAATEIADPRRATGRAAGRERRRPPAVMAAKRDPGLMKHEWPLAVRARLDVTAIA